MGSSKNDVRRAVLLVSDNTLRRWRELERLGAVLEVEALGISSLYKITFVAESLRLEGLIHQSQLMLLDMRSVIVRVQISKDQGGFDDGL